MSHESERIREGGVGEWWFVLIQLLSQHGLQRPGSGFQSEFGD